MKNKKIKNCLKKIFPNKNIKDDLSKLKIGSYKSWDSLAHLNLLLLVEKEFKIKFPLKLIYEIRSIKEIISFLNKNKKQ